VQDCGTTAGFVFHNRESQRIEPGDPGAPDNVADLATQPTCRDLVDLQLRRTAVALGAFFGLGLVGAICGIIDDRIDYHRAPRFESLLRPLPDDAPVRLSTRLRVDEDEIDTELPLVEPPQVAALVAGLIVALVALPVAAGVGDTTEAVGQLSWTAVALGVLAVMAAAALGVAERVVAYDRVNPGTAARVVATGMWRVRVAPLVGWYGLDFHHLRRSGTSRDDADTQVGDLQAASLTAHLVVLVAASVVALGDGAEPTWTRGVVAVGLLVVFVVLGAATSVPARIAGLPMRPRRVPPLASFGPLVAIAGVRVLFDGAIVAAAVAALGGGVSGARLVAVAAVATVAGAATPLPSGSGVVEATLFIGLVSGGMAPGSAAVAALLARLLSTWVPMIPGAIVARWGRHAEPPVTASAS
jgi:uncharacterized membrane protein YbhN (UPF0104 family)